MSMTVEEKIAHVEESTKQAHKRLDGQEERLDKLEENTAILKNMDYRMGKLEETTDKIDCKLNSRIEEKGKKWDKLIDYIFYFFVAIALGYMAFNNLPKQEVADNTISTSKIERSDVV